MKKTKKATPLPSRPEPPAVKEIVDDIENAPNDDIIFTEPQRLSKDNRSIEDGSEGESFTSEDDMVTNNDPEIENVYQQTLEFIKMTERLKDAPQTLENQCQYLKEVGGELSSSVEELKSQTKKLIKLT